ncbi:hypothetical protein C8J57DRAFT_1719818 [Mycena rebaudengoi]|nr:hypothetical protein C8J57DRAFT_1719818 [Mycena rebaudengoi]
MSDPTMCRGKDADGSQCICTRSTATKEDDQGRNVCVNCGHIESAHPLDVPRPGALVRKFRDAALLPRKASTTGSTSALKATEEEAIAETSSGLRKRKPATDTEPPSSKKVKKEKDTAKEKDSGRAKGKSDNEVEVGKIVLLSCGLTKNGELKDPKPPSIAQLDVFINCGLAVLSRPGNILSFNKSSTTQQLGVYFRKQFPDALAYVARRRKAMGDLANDEDWVAVIKSKHTLSVSAAKSPTGVELSVNCKVGGRKAEDRILYIAAKVGISDERYNDWLVTSDEAESEDHLSFDELVSPPRPKPVGRFKAKSTLDMKEPVVKLEKDDPEKDDPVLPDMKRAAKMRTRLDSGAIIWNDNLLTGSSEDAAFIISDNDDPPAAPTLALAASGAPSAMMSHAGVEPDVPAAAPTSNDTKSPLFSALNRTPSPEPDLSNDWDYTTYIPDLPVTSTLTPGWASTSSAVTSHTPTVPAPSWNLAHASGSLSTSSTPVPAATAEVLGNEAGSRRHGKGKSRANPWA